MINRAGLALALLSLGGLDEAAYSVETVVPLRKEVVDFMRDHNPVNLLPRLTPVAETVSGIARPRLDLNRTWRFHPSPASDFWKGRDESGWSDIRVPGQWVMQGFRVKPRAAAGYRLRFQVPADWAGQRVKLRFDAVYSKADVWLNGTSVGSHLGAFTPFEFDVTKAVLPGKENLLALAVASDSLADALTVGLEMVGHPMGGIIRRVSLFAVPTVNVSALDVETKFDRQYRNATLRVMVDVANENGQAAKGTVLHLALRQYGPHGAAVDLQPSSKEVPAMQPGQVVPEVLEIPVERPKKWDAEHPNLYVLTCEVRRGRQLYSVTRRFGFRQTEIRDGKLLLNGQPIRLRGMSRQDTHPLTGRTVSAEINRQDIQWMLWANCNNTYTCAFLPDEEILDLCDEAGLYVMDEPGTCWVYPGARSGYAVDDPKLFPHLLQPVLEMVQRDRNHPSVITWMVCDESSYGRNWREVLKMTRAVDPARPVHMAFDPPASPFDLGSWHYPNPAQFAEAAACKRPVVFDQSVSAYFVNVPELMVDPGLRDDWGRQYEAFWEKLWATPAILGGQAFNLNDDQYLPRGGPVTGNGDWGFVDPWRRAKPEMWHIRKVHTPVKVHDGPLPLPAAGHALEIPVENRYDFANFKEVRIQWSLGGESGVAQADVAPHQKGTIAIRLAETSLEGKTLALEFFRNNVLVDAYRLPIGRAVEPPLPALHKPSRAPELVQTEQTITVTCDGFQWIVNRQTGQVITAGQPDRPVLARGPVLMVLPVQEFTMTPGFPLGGPTTPDGPRPQAFTPFNTTCTDWKASSVAAKSSADGVEIVVAGRYKEASGSYTLRILGGGDAELRYRFTSSAAYRLGVRQIGMVFYVPRQFDTLSWKRKAQWSVYPADHIGRAEGEARAMPDPSLAGKEGRWMETAYREKPTWPWQADVNELGTRDFRATRRAIWRASLQSPSGDALTIFSDGSHHHTRAFLDGDRIGLLVAWFSGPGGWGKWLHGMEQVVNDLPLKVKKGTALEDTVRFSLAPRR